MQKKYSRSHIGEEHITKQGYTCEVIDGGSEFHKCTIKIESYIIEAKYSNVKNGRVRYPYHKSVFGIGYFGEGEYKSRINRELSASYSKWIGMLQRCYDKNYELKQPTYKDVTVCEQWHNFQIFANWFYNESNYQDGWELDKDILSEDDKIYSPETCIFLPKELNGFIANERNATNQSSKYSGVCFNKKEKKFKARLQVDKKRKVLGVFNNTPFGEKRAAAAYRKARRIEVEKMKEKYRDVLPEKIINNIR